MDTHKGNGFIMAHIKLGSITPDKVSLFKVQATSDDQLEYKYLSGKLPPGLSVDPSGEIIGKTTSLIADIDSGSTILDGGDTTIDRRFNFTVQARNKAGSITSSHEFYIDHKKITNDSITEIYAKVHPDKITRVALENFLTDPKTFPDDSIYRMGDKNFQTDRLKVLLLSGVHKTDLTNLFNAMGENFYNTKLRMGTLKVAKAKDPNGTVLYEIIYAELLDGYTGAPNTVSFTSKNLPSIVITYSASSATILASFGLSIAGSSADKVYINSIENMRNVLKENLTVTTHEYLPHWMKSTQNNNVTPGFKLVFPIKYVKPGEADKILYRINKEQTFDLSRIFFEIDRLYITSNTGTTIDVSRPIDTYQGDGSTRSFVLSKYIAFPKNVIVTVDGIRVNTHGNVGDSTSVDVELYTISSDPSTHVTTLTFTSDYGAPADGSVITFQRKKTTIGLSETTTFDKGSYRPEITCDNSTILADTTQHTTDSISSIETTFDGNGTVFNTQPVTFDQKQPADSQVIMQRSNIMDQINNISKQRELIRTAL